MIEWKAIVDTYIALPPLYVARAAAYFLAPAIVIGLSNSGSIGLAISTDFNQSISIVNLQSEISETSVQSKDGFAVIVEPEAPDFSIPLAEPPTKLWTSLDKRTAKSNKSRMSIGYGGIEATAPFLGVDGPVAIIAEGKLGDKILIPGGTRLTSEFHPTSRKAVSIVSHALLACIFAFGVSVATGLPSVKRDQNT